MKLVGQYAVVFNCHRGIYFGKIKKLDRDRKMIELTEARHCFYRPPTGDPNCEGNYSLAVKGPLDGAKIGPEVNMLVFDVANVVPCTKEAVERWKNSSWSN